MARLVEELSVGILVLLGIGYAVLPATVGELLSPGFGVIVDGITWADESLPQPVFIATVFLITSIVAILIALSFARVFYQLLRHAGPRTRYAYDKVTPSTPIGKVAVGFSVMVLFLLASVWVLPSVIGDLGENSAVSGADDMTNGSDAQQSEHSIAKDTDRTAAGAAKDAAAYRRPTPDRDGDRLKDEWERAGETPAGAELPNADPDRMDLYVQLNYGGGTIPLSDREKETLRQIFTEMPVENPDGSQGITLHLDDSPPHGGAVGSQVTVESRDTADVHRYYTRQNLQSRQCRYHQVVFGTIDDTEIDGIANTPGYAAVVRGKPYDFDSDVSPRVQLVTHLLLHNVVDDVDGESHTTDGWLAPTIESDEKQLSAATARKLETEGFAGSGYYQQNVCN